jgi:hypothetical protein
MSGPTHAGGWQIYGASAQDSIEAYASSQPPHVPVAYLMQAYDIVFMNILEKESLDQAASSVTSTDNHQILQVGQYA